MSGAPTAASLRVRHLTRYDYDAPVELAHHLAHLRPRATPAQAVCNWRLQVAPEPDESGADLDASIDVFGNWRHCFSHARVHDRLEVLSSFEATLMPRDPADGACSPPWEQVAARLRYRAGSTMPEACEFALGSPHAPRSPAFVRFAGDLFTPNRPLLDAAGELMQRVHQQFEYQAQSTDVATDALRALQLRRGVCQDFAHVMIAVCRSMGLAARYVSGYLSTRPPAGQPRLVGSDASHAWVSVWCPVQGWIDFDPTNNLRPALDHVTLAWGRDYGDVAPLRGVIRGGTGARPQVQVTVEPV
jgi:transglutaminase-like putative cysteine protease